MTWAANAWASAPWAALQLLPQPPAPSVPSLAPDVFDPRRGGALVWVVDIEARQQGAAAPSAGPAWASVPWASQPPAFTQQAGLETIRISDLGWRDALPYPPLLADGPNIERRVALAPNSSGTYAWGSIRLAAPGSIPGTFLAGRDTAMRQIRVRVGMQGFDRDRGIPMDPPRAQMVSAFLGLGMTWQARQDGAEVPLRDPTAWLDAPIGTRRFLGTGGAEGPADLAGRAWPIVRGGSLANPVRNCPVVLVNAANRIYRWTDGPGTLVALYEDGAPVYTYAGDVADVFASGSPGAGAYYSSNAQGMFRLGGDPAGEITVDGAGGGSTAAGIIADLLLNKLSLPPEYLDAGSIAGLAAAFPWLCGWAWSGEETGRDAIQPLLAAINARLVASRAGGLRLWPLRALGADARPVARLTVDTAVSADPVPLSAPLMPPAAVWAAGYLRTTTTTTSPKASVTPAERERLAQPWRQVNWVDVANLGLYAQPSRPDRVETALLAGIEAQALANALGALWGVPRSLWQVTLPTASAVLREIGDVVAVDWPADGLRGGVLGQVVGDSLRAGEANASLLILV